MSLKLSLGAIQYYWPKQTVFAWYDRIAKTDVDIIYLGETVCARRHELRLADWLAIADNLAASGKEVLLASQTLLESESDLKRLRKIAKQARYPIEANDMGAVKLARDHGHPFVAGASLNLYNEHTLALIRRLGAYRWQPPAELSRAKLATLLAASADPGETELFAWGKIPLAYSSRCFTARHYNLNKDNCQFRCIEHPHGMTMDTREKTPFLTINGIQTMSHGSQSLLAHHADIAALGISIFRLSPQLEHMPRIIELHRQVIAGHVPIAEALHELAPLALGTLVDGYWHGNPGIEKIKTYYSEANAGPIYQPEEVGAKTEPAAIAVPSQQNDVVNPNNPLPPWGRVGVGAGAKNDLSHSTTQANSSVPHPQQEKNANTDPSKVQAAPRKHDKSQPGRVLPAWVAHIGRKLPALPPRLVLVHTLNHMLRRGLLPADMNKFAGRHFQLDVLDLGISIRFSANRQQFTSEDYPGKPDLRLAANSIDYLHMILREEDPDTLFFNRKLQIEGDTALGLTTKNLLDCVDWRWQRVLPAPLTDWLQNRKHRYTPGAA